MSLTLAEARHRAGQVAEVAYDISLDLTDRDSFGCRTVVRFAASDSSTFLELTGAEDLRVSGAEASYDGRRIALSGLGPDNRVVVEARLPYVSDGEGMHAFTDPADGEVYVGAYCGMDLAQRIFPCFDQNDLKAAIALRVTAPPSWRVLANGRTVAREGGTWTFATTPPIPPALFIVAAGPFRSVEWEHAGLPFGWHARASLSASLERDAAWLRTTTEACFAHYAEIFDEPYPFDSYDQVFVPGLNWGAQEMPGCVSYRDELLPVGDPTEPERRDLAMIIAHEMSHMWFGDLVTMTWWEDTWLQESFADYLGFRVAEDAVGLADTMADFTVGWKPRAYLADERRSTHPVAPLPGDVPDVEVADGNFDSLSYAKGNAVLRQLVTWVGDDAFLTGVNAYLTRHRWGNATLVDFVAALDESTERDVAGWAQAWLRTTGFDTIRARRSPEGVTLTRDGFRPHRLRVAWYDDRLGTVESRLVDLADDPLLLPPAAAVLPNAAGETYARIRLDADSWSYLTAGLARIAEPSARAVVWSTAMDLVTTGELSASGLVELVEARLPDESHPATVLEVLEWVRRIVVPRWTPPDEVGAALEGVASACRAALERTSDPRLTVLWTRALATTSRDADLLEGWLRDGRTGAGVPVDATLRWLTLHRLAALGAVDARRLAAEREADGTVTGVRGELRALAARPSEDAKAEAWRGLVDDPAVSNRSFSALVEGLWDPEQAALLEPWVARCARELVPLARARGRSFEALAGDAFPALWLSADQLAVFEEALAADVPTHLRRCWEDRVDDCRRALSPGSGVPVEHRGDRAVLEDLADRP